MTPSALIIDDEPDIRELIAMTLSRLGLDCHTAGNLEEARNLLGNYEFDVCLTDMKLPDGNGVDFVRELQQSHPHLPVAVITAHGNMEAAVEAMKYGAFDFVSKPVDISLLRRLVMQAVEEPGRGAKTKVHKTSGPDLDATTEPAPPNSDTPALSPEEFTAHITAPITGSVPLTDGEHLVGTSIVMEALRSMVRKLGKSNAPVLIYGESGTGKELIARLIHNNSFRQKAPFIAINCGAIPAELLESELFGHRKGSFTGATTDHEGLFLAADGGTLFLDEVAELPLSMQVKLLRAIQERAIRRIGDSNETTVDVRILSASHRDLAMEVENGQFRHDLYYRLNVIALQVPALRHRAGDIPALIAHVLRRLTQAGTISSQTRVDASAMARLVKHPFPGNVRELENILERACALSDKPLISADDLTIDNHAMGLAEQSAENLTQPVRHMGGNERQHLIEILQAHHWNRKQTARTLGLTYRQLRYRLERLDIRN